jgi:DNA-binding response OmpR family regulator
MSLIAAQSISVKSLPTITIVEDDENVRCGVCSFLQHSGLRVWGAESAEQFYERQMQETADLVVVDLSLPRQEGIGLIRQLAERHVPVIALTGQGDVQSRLDSLKAGALQCFVKPTDPNELLAGIRSQLRHVQPHSSAQASPARQDNQTSWHLDRVACHLIAPDERSVRLTGGECELIDCLMKAKGAIVSKPELVAALGYDDEIDGIRCVEAHLARVRRKALQEIGTALPVRAIFGKGLAFLMD